jgi:MFS family permease
MTESAPAREPLITPAFALIVASGLAYFMAIAMLNPVLPLYVKNSLGGGDVGVGVAVGAFALGAVLLRPGAGVLGDRYGRKLLLVGGAAVVAVATACYGLVESLPWLVGTRLLAGLGEAAFFVGAATMITDLAPETRRGEALSYWSIAVYGGLAFGPFFGELVLGPEHDEHFVRAFAVSAVLAGLAVAIGLLTRDPHDPSDVHHPNAADTDASGRVRLLHRRALAPGLVLLMGQLALAGWTSFTELYGRNELGLAKVGPVFLLYGVLVLLVRIFGARLPDQLGARRAGTMALASVAIGMTVIAAWSTPAGLYTGTAIFAIGMSLMYPALLVLALDGVPAHERGSVVGTFSSFFDLSQGLGAALCGLIVGVAGYPAMWASTAVIAVGGIGFLRGRAAVQVAPYDAPA